MGWGERHDTPLIGGGTTGEMSLAQDALAAVGIKKPNLALAAIEAAGIIDRQNELLHCIAVARRGDCPDVDNDLGCLPEEIEGMWRTIRDEAV